MKSKKFTKVLTMFLCTVMVIMIFPITANADMGPKPSVRITFENLGNEECWGTLLSSKESTGPSSAWNGKEEDAQHNENPNGYYSYQKFGYDVWKAFVDYAENDDFFFLQEAWLINETKELAWTYYPPNEFKILLYFPETGEFSVSGAYERYAFDSYFRVTMDGLEIKSVDDKAYDFTWELISLACRVVVTIALELAIALLFVLRQKKLIMTIFGVNVVTQIGLNVALNIINYNRGAYMFVFCYVLLEILVFIVEAVAYTVLFRKGSEPQISKKRTVSYALVANIVSFIGGMAIAQLVPGIF